MTIGNQVGCVIATIFIITAFLLGLVKVFGPPECQEWAWAGPVLCFIAGIIILFAIAFEEDHHARKEK